MADTGVPPTAFQQFKKSKIAIPFALVLTGLIAFTLLVYASALFCLMPAVIAFLCFWIPWYFGLKDRKKLAVFGLVLFILMGVGFGLVKYDAITNASPPDLSSSDGLLTHGTVSPFMGAGATTYSFSVHLNGGTNHSEVYVVAYNSRSGVGTRYNMTCDPLNQSASPFIYRVDQDLPNSVFLSSFFFKAPDGTLSATPYGYGPIGPSHNDILSYELYYEVLVVFLNIGLLFYVILLLTWWMDSNKKKFEAMQKQRAAAAGNSPDAPVAKEGATAVKTEKFVCSACGAEVPAEAKECPQCGEKFDE